MAVFRRMTLVSVVGMIFLLALGSAAGAALDTSGPVICAFTNGFDCDNAEGCEAATPESVGLPGFIKLDMANNKVTTAGAQQTGDKRETTIRGMHEADGKLFLQGIERRGWSAVIDKETGEMTLAASTPDEAIVFFGRCTAP